MVMLQKWSLMEEYGHVTEVVTNSPFPRCAMAANLVHCGIESGRKQNKGCYSYCEKNISMT